MEQNKYASSSDIPTVCASGPPELVDVFQGGQVELSACPGAKHSGKCGWAYNFFQIHWSDAE